MWVDWWGLVLGLSSIYSDLSLAYTELMQTKSHIGELLTGLLLLLCLLWIPAFAIGRLVDPPYNMVGWAITLTVAWLVFRRRERGRFLP